MQDALAETNNLIARGKLHIPVEKSYTLAEAATAHVDSHAGHTRGRRETPPGPAVRLGALDVACHDAVSSFRQSAAATDGCFESARDGLCLIEVRRQLTCCRVRQVSAYLREGGNWPISR